MSTPQPQQDQITLLVYRVDALERTVAGFNSQLSSYVRERENDLKLKMLQDTATHIGDEVGGLKSDMHVVRNEVSELKDDLQRRDAAQQQSQSQVQIKVLVAVVSSILVIVSGVLIGYLTHLFH